MARSALPPRPSLEYLKKLAKERLARLRRTDPHARLAAAQLAVARDHGFPSWRALKAEVDRRGAGDVDRFFEACKSGDTGAVRQLLANEPALARAENPRGRYRGWTGLHTAAQQGRYEIVRLLLEHGADPNAREEGDNTTPLHWAGAARQPDIIRALLDAGSDVQGVGDLHELDTIGWATFFHPHGGKPGDQPDAARVLLERGAKHHIFSALSLNDVDAIRMLARENRALLNRRMSRFEQGMTALHIVIQWKRYDLLDLLIGLGIDLEGKDRSGQTALAVATGKGDREATNRLRAAGAKMPKLVDPAKVRDGAAKLAGTVKWIVPMIHAPDIAATLAWYTSIGFTEVGRFEDDGDLNWAMVSYGKVQIMLNKYGKGGPRNESLWIYMDNVDELYRLLKSRQLAAAEDALEGRQSEYPPLDINADMNEPFYGGREFGVMDPNGYSLMFRQDQ